MIQPHIQAKRCAGVKVGYDFVAPLMCVAKIFIFSIVQST